MSHSEQLDFIDGCEVAIVGMAGRFPKAADVEAFWRNLADGRECVSYFSDDELEVADASPEFLNNPNFVKAKAILDEVEWFDAAFFNVSAREAEYMDPQQRLFLECAWTALEHAGYDPAAYRGAIAVYAGSSMNSYILSRLPLIAAREGAPDSFQLAILNDKDHLATRVSYKLGLRGESLTVQTACSTSLVAVHLACQSLLSGQSDMALAGGVSIQVPQRNGYLYQEGMVGSPDGHCRAFDHRARGTVSGNGLGVVVLKLLSRAIEDGDTIHAIIKGSAINNDGRAKVGYTAPSVEGQSDVIAKALAMAGVDAETVGYVEAHGTGTPVGDPIEIEALTLAYRGHTARTGFCAVGAVKTSIGHLDAAAGVAGLIKTVLALKHASLPPTLHFEKPNPAIDFAASPFYVNTELRPWQKGSAPRRAGVSSFGIGGTNAHVILEEAPALPAGGPSRPWQLLTLSARSAGALRARAADLARHLETAGDEFADIAFTANLGRQSFAARRFVVARGGEEAAERLRAAGRPALVREGHTPRCVFLFPGQGAQAVDMGRGLYESEAALREPLDQCAAILRRLTGLDLFEFLFAGGAAAARLAEPQYTLPALFAVEYALARMWEAWGVRAQAMLGHSFGEYVAACLAGVFRLEDGLSLAATRGRLMQRMAPGAMLAVRLREDEAAAWTGGRVALASVNSETGCVLSGPAAEIEAAAARLAALGVACKRLDVPFAYHSPMLDDILPEFAEAVGRIDLQTPARPYVSSLTGTWIEPAQATSPAYWVEQMRRTVRFADGVRTLAGAAPQVFLEVGPGKGLTGHVQRAMSGRDDVCAVASLPRPGLAADEQADALRALGELWQAGVEPDWEGFYGAERRRRVPLPTYPFERKRYWLDMDGVRFTVQGGAGEAPAEEAPAARHEVERDEGQNAYAAPRTPVEGKLADIWGDVLGVSGVGVNDSFYDLGGDSLLATQVYARIAQAFPGDLSLQEMLSHPTIAELAPLVEAKSAAGDEAASRIPPTPRGADAPLSFAQERMWFVENAAPGTAVYNLGAALRLTGPLSVAAVARSLSEIVRRHEALRTVFAERGGLPVQVILPAAEFRVPVADLSALAEADRRREIERLAAAEARRPFDLARGPLLRASLVRVDAAEHVALFCMHHIICDGWSFGILVREFARLYAAFAAGEASPLAELPIQYADYAHWQRRRMQGERMARELAYWRGQLGGRLPVLDMPTDRPRPAVRSTRGATVTFAIDGETAAALKALARRENVTLFTLLLAAFQTLLHRHSGQNDLIVGCPVAGRVAVETEGLIGLFLNSLAMRADCSGNPAFDQFLRQVDQTARAAFAHQEVPFDRLVEVLQPERSLSRTPIFQVFFNFQNTPAEAMAIAGLSISRLEFDNAATGFDLIFNLAEAGDRINGVVQYSTDLFERPTVERLAASFGQLLRSVVADPTARLQALSMRGERERAEDEARDRANRFGLKQARRRGVALPEEEAAPVS